MPLHHQIFEKFVMLNASGKITIQSMLKEKKITAMIYSIFSYDLMLKHYTEYLHIFFINLSVNLVKNKHISKYVSVCRSMFGACKIILFYLKIIYISVKSF